MPDFLIDHVAVEVAILNDIIAASSEQTAVNDRNTSALSGVVSVEDPQSLSTQTYYKPNINDPDYQKETIHYALSLTKSPALTTTHPAERLMSAQPTETTQITSNSMAAPTKASGRCPLYKLSPEVRENIFTYTTIDFFNEVPGRQNIRFDLGNIETCEHGQKISSWGDLHIDKNYPLEVALLGEKVLWREAFKTRIQLCTIHFEALGLWNCKACCQKKHHYPTRKDFSALLLASIRYIECRIHFAGTWEFHGWEWIKSFVDLRKALAPIWSTKPRLAQLRFYCQEKPTFWMAMPDGRRESILQKQHKLMEDIVKYFVKERGLGEVQVVRWFWGNQEGRDYEEWAYTPLLDVFENAEVKCERKILHKPTGNPGIESIYDHGKPIDMEDIKIINTWSGRGNLNLVWDDDKDEGRDGWMAQSSTQT